MTLTIYLLSYISSPYAQVFIIAHCLLPICHGAGFGAVFAAVSRPTRSQMAEADQRSGPMTSLDSFCVHNAASGRWSKGVSVRVNGLWGASRCWTPLVRSLASYQMSTRRKLEGVFLMMLPAFTITSYITRQARKWPDTLPTIIQASGNRRDLRQQVCS